MPFVHEKGSQHLNTLESCHIYAFYAAIPNKKLPLFSIAESVPVPPQRKQPLFARVGQVYSHAAHTVTVRPVDALLYKMERSGYLIYENVSFSHLMASLERKFNVTIHYNSQKYADEYYNVKFAPHETLEDVLAVLQQLIGIRFKIKGNVVFIN